MCVQPKLLEGDVWDKPQFQTWTVEGAEWDLWTARWLERVEQYYKLT